MSWSLKLRGGDLALGGASLGTVENEQKLVQDLRCALLEPRGFDLVNPDFGSTLDGGYVNGKYVDGVIGDSDIERVRSKIVSEIQRVAQNQQARQVARANADRARYGASTLTANELLKSISNIEIYQIQDTLLVRVTLSLGERETTLDIPIAGNVVN